jgi:hypothetical protein
MIGIKLLVDILCFNHAIVFLVRCSSFIIIICLYNSLLKWWLCLKLSLQGGNSYRFFLRDIYEDVIQNLVDLSAAENIFISQPCRDNTLYLLKLIDEMLISEIDKELPVLG